MKNYKKGASTRLIGSIFYRLHLYNLNYNKKGKLMSFIASTRVGVYKPSDLIE